jgi:hypothetical protein
MLDSVMAGPFGQKCLSYLRRFAGLLAVHLGHRAIELRELAAAALVQAVPS